jgi:hypothetical protein
MTQLTEQDLATIKELINNNTALILEKIQSVSDKIDLLKERIERIEKNNDKVSTAIIVAVLSVFVAGLIKWVLPDFGSLK